MQAEFEKKHPLRPSRAQSAPDRTTEVGGRADGADFAVDSFATSYGDPQPVAVTARRDIRNLAMKYSINGGGPTPCPSGKARW